MSDINTTINFPRDTTIQSMTAAIQDGNAKLVDSLNSIAAVIGANGTYDYSSLAKIKYLVKLGLAEKVIPVGSQVMVPWTDTVTGTKYTFVWDVVHYGKVALKDGEQVNGLYLQSHYATPYGVQFDNYEAFYAATSTLPAGTYNITMGSNWAPNVVSGKSYQFTLTKDVPAGGQLSGFESCPSLTVDKWTVKSWKTSADTTPIETVQVAEGTGGTSLGMLKAGGDGTLNCLQRVGYGYNRWSQSAVRQWLNSTSAANAWWTPQHNFDRFPAEFLTKNGFLSGFEADFLGALTPVKVTTLLNQASDTAVGVSEDTYDKIFLPSLEQEFITPQLVGVEGDTWKYWRQASGRTSFTPYSTPMPEYVTYGLDAKTTPYTVRLRSAGRGYSYLTWYVNSTGGVGSYYVAASSLRCAPACVIC